MAYGALSGFLVLYLSQVLQYSSLTSLLIASLTLVGAAAWSLIALPPLEARIGRRRTLLVFGALFATSALLLYLAWNPELVILAVLLGGVAASTADNGPLASLDQTLLPSVTRPEGLASVFAWYNLLASFASAGGALLLALPGALSPQTVPFLPPTQHPYLLLIYLALAVASGLAYLGLSQRVESPPNAGSPRPLPPKSRGRLRDLSVLFGVDAFAGGMVVNPLLAFFFEVRWQQPAASIGTILFLTGTVSALSFLLASRLAGRFGLLRTMVATHLPSNVMLALVPFMPTFGLALGILLARSSLSQMDVPTRQAYVMQLAEPEERLRFASTLSGARGAAQSVGPFSVIALFSAGLVAVPFALAGSLKVVYDLVLWQRFRRVPLQRAEAPAPRGL